ncbi:MAG: hypothetical protein EXQ91_03255 [Alphaproteobacteria bacterium]|nr:hypothetical protein [Alphaproteobacteria bacterium]
MAIDRLFYCPAASGFALVAGLLLAACTAKFPLPDPSDPASVPQGRTTFSSAPNHRPFSEPEQRDWRAANDELRRQVERGAEAEPASGGDPKRN